MLQRLFRSRRVRLSAPRLAAPQLRVGRGPRDLVVLLDGTLSSLEPGKETNIGLIYRTLSDVAPERRPILLYEPGLQWREWRRRMEVMTGTGINRQIRRAYGFLARRYRPGDRIFLMGYSRGAFAARSLAGVIDRVGLLRYDLAVERHIREIYRHYREAPHSEMAKRFAAEHCHQDAAIEMVGVFDTVKALGIRLPLLWRVTEREHEFHSHHLGHHIRHGFHALALNESREAFAPLIWECPDDWAGRVEQVWFRGSHGDIGGQLCGFLAARPLSNIPLVWMLSRAEELDLPLPPRWWTRFPTDPAAPSSGNMRGWGKVFLLRRPREVGRDPSERLHPTALPARNNIPDLPLAGPALF